jgi:hypothetical protein
MTLLGQSQRLPAGYSLFARYAFAPNELGYCGPDDADVLLRGDDPERVAEHARGFEGTWPYLRAISDAAGMADPLDVDVVRNYWVGGPLLDVVDPGSLLEVLRKAFAGQVSGLLSDLSEATGVLAHHSFHVFVVYPWVRFLDRDSATALRVLQSCRIRWGTVESVDDEHVMLLTRALTYADGVLALGDPAPERVRWIKNGASTIDAPRAGEAVSAHWDWVCDRLTDADCTALETATQTTLELVGHESAKLISRSEMRRTLEL